MISPLSARFLLAPLLAAALASCGDTSKEGVTPADWGSMIAAGDGKSAEAALRRELASGTDVSEIAPYLGEAELLQGNLREAERWLTRHTFSADTASHGYRMLGRLRMQQGDFPAAGRAFDRALAANAEDSDLWVDIGRLRWRGGEQAQAHEASQFALRHGPANPAAILFRAQHARETHGNRAALQLLEQGLDLAPENPDLLAEYAATLGDLGRASDMLAITRKLATAAPNHSRALFLQAVLAARAGRTDLASALLQRSGEIERQLPAAIVLQALIDMEAGNYASAAKSLNLLARRQPDNIRIQSLLARALALGGNHRELVARFSDRAPTPYIAMLVGRGYEALGDRRNAATFIDAAIAGPGMRAVTIRDGSVGDSGPDIEGSSVVMRVRDRIARGRVAEGRAMAEAFLARNPGSSDAAALAGDAALAAGDAQGAVKNYRRALAIRRTWPLVKRMAAALDLSGETDAATNLIADYLDGEPRSADVAAVLAKRLEAGQGTVGR